jgi:glyoxylase-like metal-dependent hydrolase (beta-lactamase superfamily II)
VKSATQVYGAARFAELFDTIEPIPEERVGALDDGASFELGDTTLRVWHTAGHAFHHLVVHDPAIDIVYTGDAFGLVYPDLQRRGRFVLPSTSPIGFDAPEAHESVERVLAIGARTACQTHFGPYQDLDVIAVQLHEWLARAGAWVDEAARGDETIEAMTERLTRAWRAAIEDEVARRDLGFGPEEWSALALDVELNAQGLAFAAEAKRSSSSASR